MLFHNFMQMQDSSILRLCNQRKQHKKKRKHLHSIDFQVCTKLGCYFSRTRFRRGRNCSIEERIFILFYLSFQNALHGTNFSQNTLRQIVIFRCCLILLKRRHFLVFIRNENMNYALISDSNSLT